MPSDRLAAAGSHLKTLQAIFSHPLTHNLDWSDAVALINKIGEVDHKASNEVTFEVAGERHRFRKPHNKNLAGSDVMELRKFLPHAGWSPLAPAPADSAASPAPTLMVVVDHHGARLFSISGSSDGASRQEIEPYDPHHFLHHLAHKDQSREQGQRAPEDTGFYERIAQALAAVGSIIVVGHGTGKSNAAHHLGEYPRSHHPETYQRIVAELTADLSSATTPQLLELAQEAMR